jgi:hypothetical protein
VAEPRAPDAFDWFADLIARDGYRGRFWGQSWTYLDPRDRFKYWESETIDRKGRIINRAATTVWGPLSSALRTRDDRSR